MHPKKGLAIFIGLLGIVSLVVGGVLIFLAADFVPWPECPLVSVYHAGNSNEEVCTFCTSTHTISFPMQKGYPPDL
ncbi:hypothetical protein C4564_05815 [Candidatus Microgenomates bacterium]|nr:MAG: hypothetical protein C4564_05815 [Candidatus Microgenomates bacterium]